MDKLTMAHEWAMQAIDTGYVCETKTLVSEAWCYADAMQAEADKREDKSRPDVLNPSNSRELEFQPDWSVAPNWAVAWAVDEDDTPNWFSENPELNFCVCEWIFKPSSSLERKHEKAPSFNYKGDWQDSLRKRP